MDSIYRRTKFMNRLMKWPLLCGLLGLVLTRTVPLAGDFSGSTYVNNDIVSYPGTETHPPVIDAANFVNNNSFTINFTINDILSGAQPFYETWDTVTYTNFGSMVTDTGFQFDNQSSSTGLRRMSASFYNPGTISCGSINDTGGQVFDPAYSQCLVSATNILCPGLVDVGEDGMIQMNGRNVDLTGGILNVENPLTTAGIPGAVTASATGAKGVDTNGDWIPSIDLTTTFAQSSFFPIAPFFLTLTNSQCYADKRQAAGSPIIIYRYVFVQNNSGPDVTYNVYIDDPNTVDVLGFAGAAHVEWVGNYTDPATGNPIANYLYLTDDYARGATTNAYLGGMPDNFQFLAWPTELLSNPKPLNFYPFLPGNLTNNYVYMDAVLSSSSVTTNAGGTNPTGGITNLPAAVKITAGSELNLANATVSGINYLFLNCTNQFDGSPGAYIASPYSDIYLGVPGGNMTVSNLLTAAIPNWSGTVQAFSSDDILIDPVTGFTNEYKVLIVYSDLQPTTAPWIQNLSLHDTNSLNISDPLNVYNSFYSDARIVTLQTNLLGVGATSLDGELNWVNPATFNADSASGTQQLPYLKWLTNNGAIRIANTANFGQPLLVTNPSLPAVKAAGTLWEIGTNVVKKDRVTIGTNQYYFVGTLTNKTANQVLIGATFNASMSNLIAAINHATGSGSTYSTNTRANPSVSAGPFSVANHAFTVTALTAGAAGNSIATLFTPATASSNLTWNGNSTLTGGANATSASTTGTFALSSFVNNSLITDQGTAIWSTNFQNAGTISNGLGSFSLLSLSSVLANGNLVAGGDVVLVASNSLVISNHMIQAGRKLTLLSTNISDTGPTNGNIWVVGTNSGGGTLDSGFNVPLMPPAGAGDLLGTTVTNIAPPGKSIYNVWAGTNYGVSTRGYSHNLALGQLILDAKTNNSVFYFNGVGVSNALYVDSLQLLDYATHGNATNSYNFPWLKIGTNLVIYYAQALEFTPAFPNGVSVAEQIDFQSQHFGANGGRLRWIYSYAGQFSSTNLVYPDGTTNTVNAALAGSTTIDSNGNGIPNAGDPAPIFVPSELNFTLTTTNLPPLSAKVEWTTIPNATNYIYYTTNLLATNWLAFTNFKNYYYGNNVAVTNSAHSNNFVSPQPAPGPATNVWVYDALTNMPHFYKVVVWPWLNYGEQ